MSHLNVFTLLNLEIFYCENVKKNIYICTLRQMAQATLIIMGFSMAHNMWIDGMFQSMMMMHFETMFEIQQGFHHALNHYPSVHS